jgi:hypothetical protein
VCPENVPGGGDGTTYIPFFSILAKIYPASVLWGIGSAIGEIPPYAVSRAAALAGEHVDEMDELDDLDRMATNGMARWDLMKRMKVRCLPLLLRCAQIACSLTRTLRLPARRCGWSIFFMSTASLVYSG